MLARAIVYEQAEDEGLWFVAETAAEAYLQQELRRLHTAVEAESAMGAALLANPSPTASPAAPESPPEAQ